MGFDIYARHKEKKKTRNCVIPCEMLGFYEEDNDVNNNYWKICLVVQEFIGNKHICYFIYPT